MKTNSTKILITMSILAALAVGGYAYVTYYISGLANRTSELKQYISEKKVVLKQAESLQKVAVSAVDEKAKIAGYFVPAGGAVGFISSLEKTAAGFGLDYTTQNIDQQNADNLNEQGKELLRVTFSAKGSWASIMRLLKVIETLPYGLQIDKIDLDTSPDTNAPAPVVVEPDASGQAGAPVVSGAATSGQKKTWSAIIIFSVVKTKDNAR